MSTLSTRGVENKYLGSCGAGQKRQKTRFGFLIAMERRAVHPNKELGVLRRKRNDERDDRGKWLKRQRRG